MKYHSAYIMLTKFFLQRDINVLITIGKKVGFQMLFKKRGGCHFSNMLWDDVPCSRCCYSKTIGRKTIFECGICSLVKIEECGKVCRVIYHCWGIQVRNWWWFCGCWDIIWIAYVGGLVASGVHGEGAWWVLSVLHWKNYQVVQLDSSFNHTIKHRENYNRVQMADKMIHM